MAKKFLTPISFVSLPTAPPSPDVGQVYFNSSAGKLQVWSGSEWISADTGPTGPTGPTGAASTVAGPTGPTGPTGATGASGSSTLSGLTDTTLTSPSAGEALVYNGSAWINSDSFAPRLLTEGTAQTSNYTIALADINKVVVMNGSSLSLFIPLNSTTAFPIGSVVNVYNIAATNVTIAGVSGVTLRNAGALVQYGEVSLRKRATDEWVLAGSVS